MAAPVIAVWVAGDLRLAIVRVDRLRLACSGIERRRDSSDRAAQPEGVKSVQEPMSLSSSICSVADLLRGDYRQSEYSQVILPFAVDGPKQNLRNPLVQASF
jgi:hypothetical protein